METNVWPSRKKESFFVCLQTEEIKSLAYIYVYFFSWPHNYLFDACLARPTNNIKPKSVEPEKRETRR